MAIRFPVLGTFSATGDFRYTSQAYGAAVDETIANAKSVSGLPTGLKFDKATGAISVSFTSKKGDKAKYAVELVWRGDKLFAGHVTRTWKGVVDNKSANLSAYGTAEVK